MWRIGKCRRKSWRKTRASFGAAVLFVTIWPEWLCRSKPRCVTVSRRRSESPTGQPLCHVPRCFSCCFCEADRGLVDEWYDAADACETPAARARKRARAMMRMAGLSQPEQIARSIAAAVADVL